MALRMVWRGTVSIEKWRPRWGRWELNDLGWRRKLLEVEVALGWRVSAGKAVRAPRSAGLYDLASGERVSGWTCWALREECWAVWVEFGSRAGFRSDTGACLAEMGC